MNKRIRFVQNTRIYVRPPGPCFKIGRLKTIFSTSLTNLIRSNLLAVNFDNRKQAFSRAVSRAGRVYSYCIRI
ncbi:hypothetical protein RIR_jg30732.t1 [Rhizophagus irregularis DAOM 181602=DAOM 197198]|uniref:Uncharacterized protein n=1 Tax=Rhizophagus irregularis (strain DAOM 181602 / DAOM 197198 / MUCL 43194) TaxID=747089 RepID=U9UUF1_RHIID|nr:hypothetical protein RIR_jg30732.t1 [Rhizophagus irregularis DAOM 181602=DAOM 197198]